MTAPDVYREFVLQLICWILAAVCCAGGLRLAWRGLRTLASYSRPHLKNIVFGAFLCIALICGGTKPDGGTNGTEQLNAPAVQTGLFGSVQTAFGNMRDFMARIGGLRLLDHGPEIALPAVRPLADGDYAAGIALSRIGTNETYSFDAPTNAVVCRDWLAFGATRDLFRLKWSEEGDGWTFPWGSNRLDAATVLSYGIVKESVTNAASFFAPLCTDLDILPASRHDWISGGTEHPSCLWYAFTPSNSLQITWQQVLLGGDVYRPVSFQSEFFPNGDLTYRYDLSSACDEVLSNVVVGVSHDGIGPVFNAIGRGVTSLRFARLDPAWADNPDPDDDGLTTSDELFVYHTDPGKADTDDDGLPDGAEVNTHGSDPLDPYSIRPDVPDGMAAVMGDLDPFACPDGSTNTVLEHIFYSGTTNGVFAYPVSTDEIGVLEVMVSGSGAGRLVVGDVVVPLVASQTGFTRLAGLRGGTNHDNPVNPVTNTLLLAVGRGVRKEVWFTKPDGLDVALRSDDLLIGRMPTFYWPHGWIAFPHTDATVPCIHDLEAKGKVLSLVHGEEFSGLTALWQCASPSVVITNFPPVSADVHASFSTRDTAIIRYTVDHPDRLNNFAPSFEQTLEFCPKLAPEEETSLYGSPDENLSTNSCRCVEPGGIVCGCCSYGSCNCPNPECPCQDNPVVAPDETSEEDAEDEYYAITALPEALNVLQLHGSVATQNVVHLDVPDEYQKCCSCPDHWTNHVALAYRSQRISVTDALGECFSVTNIDCNVIVRGLEPSIAPFGDVALFSTNGASYLSRKYTALGVRMDSPCGYDTSVYNSLDPSFGVPVTVNTNLANAARFELYTDIMLSNGLVRVAIENADCAAQVWLPEYNVWRLDGGEMWIENHPPLLLLDANSATERYFTIRQWREIVSHRGSGRCQPLMLVSSNAGRLDLVFSYVAEHGGNAIKTGIRQRVTFVNPPLLPDYNGDGRIDPHDLSEYLGGRTFRFWTNMETARGRYVGDILDPNVLGELNSSDDTVNGEYDLVNFFPLALDLTAFPQAWKSGLSVKLVSPHANSPEVNFCIAGLPWVDVGSIYTNDVQSVGGTALSSASLTGINYDGATLTSEVLASFGEGCGLVVAEAKSEGSTVGVEVRDAQGRTIYAYVLPSMIVNVERFYRWANLRPVCGDSSGEASSLGNPFYDLDGDSDGRHFVFVHGYNVNAQAARTWANQIFKRLWVSGSRSMFTAVDWCGDSSQFPTLFHGDVSPDYYVNVMNAFATASNLVETVASLPGTNKVMLAHSLGNMLTSSAAVDHGLQYNRYYMLNAAVPMEAYTTNVVSASAMVDSAWDNVPQNYWASGWHVLFEAPDFRSTLSWRGRFAGIANAVNCYSPTEDVLENATENGYGDAWAQQELLKGAAVWHGINSILPWNWNERVSCEGGWGINTYYAADPTYYVPLVGFYPSVTNLTREAVIAHPLFTPFRIESEAMHSTNLFCIADAHVRDMLRAKLLGDAIPATSFAAGANPLPQSVVSGNINYSDCESGEWPIGEGKWRHSDIKNVAYFFNWKLFKLIINNDRGVVNENQQ